MDNVRREMAILRKNQKEMLVIKKTGTIVEINAFDGIIRLNKDEGRISNLEDISIDTSKAKSKDNKDWKKKKKNRIPKDCGTATKGITCM